MKLKFKDTQLDITLKPTTNNIGLKKEDYWYLISLKINNNEYNYEITKEILSNNEIENTINILEQYINNKTNIKEISYITNYIKIDLLDNFIEITFIEELSKSSKKYKVILDEEEVLELINILKNKWI